MSEFKIGDKVTVEGEIISIDKFSQYQYCIKLNSGRLLIASDEEISGKENEHDGE
jgi:hypothetical protein